MIEISQISMSNSNRNLGSPQGTVYPKIFPPKTFCVKGPQLVETAKIIIKTSSLSTSGVVGGGG